MNTMWCLSVILATLVSSVPQTCFAQQDKVTKIHVTFSSYYERLRPVYAEGITNEEMTVALSGKNHIQETSISTNPAATQRWNTEHTLGDEEWHVTGRTHLLKRKNCHKAFV